MLVNCRDLLVVSLGRFDGLRQKVVGRGHGQERLTSMTKTMLTWRMTPSCEALLLI